MRHLGVFFFCFLPRTSNPPESSGTWKIMHLFPRQVIFFPFCLNIWKALTRILFLALSALEVVNPPSYEAAH